VGTVDCRDTPHNTDENRTLVSGDWCVLIGIHRPTVDGTLSRFLEIASAPPIESDASSARSVFSQEVDIGMFSFPLPRRTRRMSGRRR
jgi:hypothetical protein